MATEKMCFTITGKWVTMMSRQIYWEELRFESAYNILGTCVGMTQEQQDSVLLGKYLLSGDSNGEGFTYEEDKSDFKKTILDMANARTKRIKSEIQKEKDEILAKESRLTYDYAERYNIDIESTSEYERCLERANMEIEDPSRHDVITAREDMKKTLDAKLKIDIIEPKEEISKEMKIMMYLNENPESIGTKHSEKINKLKKDGWSYECVMNFIMEYDKHKLSRKENNFYLSPEGFIFNTEQYQHTSYADCVYFFWNEILGLDKQDFGIGSELDLIDTKGFVSVSESNCMSGGTRVNASCFNNTLTEEQINIIKTHFEEVGSFVDGITPFRCSGFIKTYAELVKAINDQKNKIEKRKEKNELRKNIQQ